MFVTRPPFCCLAPQIFSSAELVDQGGQEDEEVLQEERHPGVDAVRHKAFLLVAQHRVLPKQDVAGAKQRAGIEQRVRQVNAMRIRGLLLSFI